MIQNINPCGARESQCLYEKDATQIAPSSCRMENGVLKVNMVDGGISPAKVYLENISLAPQHLGASRTLVAEVVKLLKNAKECKDREEKQLPFGERVKIKAFENLPGLARIVARATGDGKIAEHATRDRHKQAIRQAERLLAKMDKKIATGRK